MSPASNKSLTTRWFTEVWNRQRADAIDELLLPDAKLHGLGPVISGPANFRPFHRRMIAAFPDLVVELHDVIGDGDLTACRFTFRGTHQRDSLGFAATHKPVVTTGMCMIRWRGGRIVEGYNEFDAAGAIPALQARFAAAGR
jgi:predicted ester cyclase